MTTGMEALVTISMPAAISYSLKSMELLSVGLMYTIQVIMSILMGLAEKF